MPEHKCLAALPQVCYHHGGQQGYGKGATAPSLAQLGLPHSSHQVLGRLGLPLCCPRMAPRTAMHCPGHCPRHHPTHCPTHGPRHCPLPSLSEFISSLLCKSPTGRRVCKHLSQTTQPFTSSAAPCPPFPTCKTDPSEVGHSKTIGELGHSCLQPFLSCNESCGGGV